MSREEARAEAQRRFGLRGDAHHVAGEYWVGAYKDQDGGFEPFATSKLSFDDAFAQVDDEEEVLDG